ncbi:unnamed protein product, partial [Thlaspi arvense]
HACNLEPLYKSSFSYSSTATTLRAELICREKKTKKESARELSPADSRQRQMENLPDSLYEDYSRLKPTWSSAPSFAPAPANIASPPNIEMILQWITDLHNPNLLISNFALHNLTIEVLGIYPYLSRPAFFSQQGVHRRVYNILLLFQCIADHPETRAGFLRAAMPQYFYPLMDIGYVGKPLESVRVAALGVIAHLLKEPVDEASTRYLMKTGALQYCTKPIEIGSTESKTLAVFIMNKILSTEEGIKYCCVLPDRFFAIDGLLKKLLVYLSSMAKPSSSMLNLIVSCYVSLSQRSRARDGIRHSLPFMLFDGTFARLLAEDPITENYRMQLIQILNS